jgi:hypothetical protein
MLSCLARAVTILALFVYKIKAATKWIVRPRSSAAAFAGTEAMGARGARSPPRPRSCLVALRATSTGSPSSEPNQVTRPATLPRPVRHASVSALRAARPSSFPLLALTTATIPPEPQPQPLLPPTAPLLPHPHAPLPPWQGRTRTPPPRPTTRARSAAPPRAPRGSPSPSAGSSPRTPQ